MASLSKRNAKIMRPDVFICIVCVLWVIQYGRAQTTWLLSASVCAVLPSHSLLCVRTLWTIVEGIDNLAL